MEPLEQRRKEVLDGKRSWNYKDDAGGDFDVFYSDFILPLRQLKYAGFFERLREHEGNYRGKRYDRVDILGAINFNAETKHSE